MSDNDNFLPFPRDVILAALMANQALCVAQAAGVTDLRGFCRFLEKRPIHTFFAEPCTLTYGTEDEITVPGLAWMAFNGDEWWGGCWADEANLKVWSQPDNPTFIDIFAQMRAEGAPACMARLCHHIAKRDGIYIDFDHAPGIGPLTELFRTLGIVTPEDEAAACSRWRAEMAENYDHVAALTQSRYMTLGDVAQMIDHHQRRLPEVLPL